MAARLGGGAIPTSSVVRPVLEPDASGVLVMCSSVSRPRSPPYAAHEGGDRDVAAAERSQLGQVQAPIGSVLAENGASSGEEPINRRLGHPEHTPYLRAGEAASAVEARAARHHMTPRTGLVGECSSAA